MNETMSYDDLARINCEINRKLRESIETIKSLEAFRLSSESDILRDIANSVRADYEDVMLTIGDDMDIELGEVYREKLKSIFKTLARKGVAL